MTARVRLGYSPDLAGTIDVNGLAAYGVDVQPVQWSEGRLRRGAIPDALLVSSAALVGAPPRRRALLEELVRGGTRGALRPRALLLVGPGEPPAPWAELAAAHLPELPAASALAAVVRCAVEASHLRSELTATQAALHELQ